MNVAGQSEYAAALQHLRAELEQWLTATGDPRVLGGGEIFESYPRYSPIRRFEMIDAPFFRPISSKMPLVPSELRGPMEEHRDQRHHLALDDRQVPRASLRAAGGVRCRSGGRRPAEHPLAHERRPRPAHGLLRRHVCVHAPHRPARGEGDDLRARLVERPGLRRARTALISGMYPTSLGAEHMRSMVPLPEGKAMYPQLLRQAGYYCTNNSKTDYNLEEPGKVWDESSGKAHWKNRKPGQPFFRGLQLDQESREPDPHSGRTRKCTTPPGSAFPLTTPTRPRRARTGRSIYDGVSAADADAGKRLEEIAAAGLADDTIIFYFADHGSGMPRSKRWPCNSGLQVPLVVFIPEKFKDLRPPDYRPGGKSDRLVSFVDFAPTVLSLAGLEPPTWMQGHAFLGRFQTPPQPYLFGFRGRMDERIDLVRSATDGRFVYIRNYMPHKIYGQHVDYMFETPTTRVWKSLHDAGQAQPGARRLLESEAPRGTLRPRCRSRRGAQPRRLARTPGDAREAPPRRSGPGRQHPRRRLLARRRDPQPFARSTPYDMGHDGSRYPFERVLETAELASMLRPDAVPALKAAARDGDAAVRWWAALGFLMRGRDGVLAARRSWPPRSTTRPPMCGSPPPKRWAATVTTTTSHRPCAVLAGCADWSKNDVFVDRGGPQRHRCARRRSCSPPANSPRLADPRSVAGLSV